MKYIMIDYAEYRKLEKIEETHKKNIEALEGHVAILEEDFEEYKQLKKEKNAMSCLAYQYKSTLEEIKEKITIKMARYFNEKDYCIEDTDLDELLQIIDKGVNND